ncbi:MAG: SHOCT domain-containing protein [Terracidiphilus sp.]
MDPSSVLIICAILVFCFFLVKKGWDQSNEEAATRQRLLSQHRLRDLYISPRDSSLVGLNFEEQKMILGAGKREKVYDFALISSVEVIENGVTLTSTNRGSQVLGAVVGGLFGPAGAVIGGLSGSSRTRGRLRGITLKIFVDDQANPVCAIPFFWDESSKGTDPDEPRARQARENVDRFHAYVLNAMRQAQKQGSPNLPTASASELRMLWEMKLAGALTEEEFMQQKSRLLGDIASTAGSGAASGPGPSLE